MIGAKCETETIAISTSFSFFSYDKDRSILMFHFLNWTSTWNDLQF